MQANHVPVLCEEVINMLDVKPNGIYIDATFGAGGMTAAILARQPKKVIGFDRDPSVEKMAKILQDKYGNFEFVNSNFGQMDNLLKTYHGMVDGVVFDLGVSSMQLDNGERGFSFMQDAPLDMRMNQSDGSQTAADIVNQTGEGALADIFYRYGEEKKSRAIAKKIIATRQTQPITTTAELSQLVVAAIGRHGKHHPATRVFQALRIAVNNELVEVMAGLESAATLLKNGGRLVAISFHSLEDKIIKDFFKTRSGKAAVKPSRHMPSSGSSGMESSGMESSASSVGMANNNISLPSFKILTKKPITANDIELADNPRSRSAKLRCAMKLATA